MGDASDILLTRLAGGPQLRQDELAAIDDAQWRALDALAADHRLQPLLHARWQHHAAVPEALKVRWSEARREAAVTALAQRRTLRSIVARLAEAGLRAIALKGSWLAWHVYPEAALRPLRDLDLLLAPEDALAARELLIADGWHEAEPSALPPEAWLARFKHLPELVSPDGIWLDLHARLWDDDGRAPALPPGLWERAVPDAETPALLYLSPVDQLMHLAIHASQHRFDGGPLMLADIDRLLAREHFDWRAVTARAEAEGWARPLAIVLAATQAWGCQGMWRGPELSAPSTLVADVPHLLAKPISARSEDIGALKRGRNDIGLGEKLRRVWVRRERYPTGAAWLNWIMGEVRLMLRARGDHALTLRQARAERLDRWLRGV